MSLALAKPEGGGGGGGRGEEGVEEEGGERRRRKKKIKMRENSGQMAWGRNDLR